MFRLNIQQNQWILLALLGGIALMLLSILIYPATWKPRDTAVDENEAKKQVKSFPEWIRSFMPSFLIVLFVLLFVWGLIYMIQAVISPPNW